MEYTTIQGDTWDAIAYKEYGSEEKATYIMQANPDYLDYFVFPGGIVLTIPELSAEQLEDTPPWVETGSDDVDPYDTFDEEDEN